MDDMDKAIEVIEQVLGGRVIATTEWVWRPGFGWVERTVEEVAA